MACSKCKKKQQIDFIDGEVAKLDIPVKIVTVVIVGLTLYGIISLTLKVISLF